MANPAGVPNLLDPSVVFLDVTQILTGDLLDDYGLGSTPQWGIFLDGEPVVIADTVTDLGYQQAWTISDYPVEQGGFESYDKVNSPFRIRIQFVSGGSIENREALLASIAGIGDTLTKYTVLTPEAAYPSVNVEGYEYRRTSRNGLGLMIVDVRLLEIREASSGNFQNTQDPSGFQAAPTGNVQSQETTTDITVRPLSGVK